MVLAQIFLLGAILYLLLNINIVLSYSYRIDFSRGSPTRFTCYNRSLVQHFSKENLRENVLCEGNMYFKYRGFRDIAVAFTYDIIIKHVQENHDSK